MRNLRDHLGLVIDWTIVAGVVVCLPIIVPILLFKAIRWDRSSRADDLHG